MKLTTFLLVIIFTLTTFGVTVAMRNGVKLEGQIILHDDTYFVIKTAQGDQTNKWSQMTIKSFKKVKPKLYQKLANAFEEKQEAKGLVKQGKKWITKAEADRLKYKNVEIQVSTNERNTGYKTQKNQEKYFANLPRIPGLSTPREKVYVREAYLKSSIKLTGLDQKKKYTFSVELYNFLKDFKSKDNSQRIKRIRASLKEKAGAGPILPHALFNKTLTITGKNKFDIEFKMSPYEQIKLWRKSEIYTDNGGTRFEARTTYSGLESEFYLVRIYLDDKLVYERFKGSIPKLFLIRKY